MFLSSVWVLFTILSQMSETSGLVNFQCLLISRLEPFSSTLAWRIPWREEPGRLQSMGSRRVGHDWATSLSLSTFMRWRRKWQPTPVFLPGESQGWGSLVGCRLWGCTESDTTDATEQQQQQQQQWNMQGLFCCCYCYCLISLSRFIFVVTNGRISF